MKTLTVLMLAALLSACVPIGVRGSSMPLRGGTNDVPPAWLRSAPGAP